MTEEQLYKAMDEGCPVMAKTILNGEIEYNRILGVIKRGTGEPGRYEVFAELESKAEYIKHPVEYPANRIRVKEI